MMVERHYDDEALISLIETDRIHSDAHLPSCPACADKLESFQMIADALEERDVWDTRDLHVEPVRATIATLRSFADRMSLEDTQAEPILRELLAGPREEWMPRLRRHPQWRTAGVVRKLIDETIKVVMTMPPDALEMTALSTEIADHLDATTFATDTVARLRAAAWRDRAYALFYVGSFADSLKATQRAELNLQSCVVDEYDRARVSIVKALSLRAMEDVSTAVEAVRFSAETFVEFGDMTRLASAKIAEVHLLFTRGAFAEARNVLEPLELSLRESGDATIHARVLGNLGYCYSKMGRIEEALHYNEAAASMFDALGVTTESVRLRWSTAEILAAAGRVDEAETRLEELQRAFSGLNMTSEAALVSLTLAELLLAKQEFAGVETICREAMRSFEVAGISYTARALTALAYLKEAAQLRTLTPTLVKHVQDYLRRLPQDGQLLFAPPPPTTIPQNLR